jgi:hypothetical protein
VIVESNSLLQFIRPEIYLVVLDPQQEDFKDSARMFLHRADAFVLREEMPGNWAQNQGVLPKWFMETPCFLQPLGSPLPAKLREFVFQRFFTHTTQGVGQASFPVDPD